MPAELLGPAWTVRTGAYGLGRGLGVGSGQWRRMALTFALFPWGPLGY